MVVPTRHHTRSRVGKRRSHHALKPPRLIKCPHCSSMILPHRVCPYCGYYKEKEVIDVYKGLSKKEKKKREAEIKQQEGK
ncbi:MAG: 50S ribosomal protein L32 [Candidatus Paceibacterota bacterium]